jgi:hypothetical protein
VTSHSHTERAPDPLSWIALGVVALAAAYAIAGKVLEW